ncbi:MAG TPA: hypothetical protein VD768_01765 [Sphingomicrobium sp.]|nr:hypothetical protein [Sphingomicrobium sp.]
MKFAVLIPSADYGTDWRWAYDVEAEALSGTGARVQPVRWTEARDLTSFDLILPLVAWGYHLDYRGWLRFLDDLEQQELPVANPVPLLRWNSDKAYLAELGSADVPTVPTIVAETLDEAALQSARDAFGCTQLVVKPPVSASAFGTFVLRQGDSLPGEVSGARMMVQPWLGSIVDTGEFSLIFLDGQFSHAVSKVPKAGEFRVQPEYGGIISRCEPPTGALAIADAALAAAPTPATYARVDLVVGNEGALQVIELELIEPALFLAQAPEAAPRLGNAARSAAERMRK